MCFNLKNILQTAGNEKSVRNGNLLFFLKKSCIFRTKQYNERRKGMQKEQEKARLEDLNLLDNFAFGKLVTHPEYGTQFCKDILQIILNRKVGKIQIIPQRVYYGADTDKHGVRLDVYVEEEDAVESDTIYDIEPDKNDRKALKEALPRRVRFYHSKIDENSLQSGADYSQLKRVFVIMIMSYDPFDLERMVYTVKNCCVEEPDMPYDDGAVTIFLYTKGTKGNPRRELQKLLHYMEESKEENADGELLREIHRMLESVRHDRKAAVEYMKIFEREKMLRDDGREEGKIAGTVRIIRKKLDKNMQVSEIAELLEADEQYVTKIEQFIRSNPEYSDLEITKAYMSENLQK